MVMSCNEVGYTGVTELAENLYFMLCKESNQTGRTKATQSTGSQYEG